MQSSHLHKDVFHKALNPHGRQLGGLINKAWLDNRVQYLVENEVAAMQLYPEARCCRKSEPANQGMYYKNGEFHYTVTHEEEVTLVTNECYALNFK